LSSAPGADQYRITVKHEPQGTVSSYLHRHLRVGATLDIAAPHGDFVLDDGASPVVLISAGIGVTPVLSMLHELAAERADREVWWIHGARGPGEHPLHDEVRGLLEVLPNVHRQVFYSAATPAELRYGQAWAGRLTKDKLAQLTIPVEANAYVCGPKSFMLDMQLTAIGVDPTHIHTEMFGGRSAINPGLSGQPSLLPHQPDGPAGSGPLVTFARSGISARFSNSRRNVLDLAEACDVPTRWSCRTGVCQTCITPMLSGDITYAPVPLDPPPDGQVLICCAQPRTDVVLDL
jgi:ferredoxin-NADP reductase